MHQRCAPGSTMLCYERFPRIYRCRAANLGGHIKLSWKRWKRSKPYHNASWHAILFFKLLPHRHLPRALCTKGALLATWDVARPLSASTTSVCLRLGSASVVPMTQLMTQRMPRATMMRYQPNGIRVWVPRKRIKDWMASQAAMKDTTKPRLNMGISEPCNIGRLL